MSSLRLGLKRSLSGQGDSTDGGGTEGTTAAQQPVAKKKKAPNPKPRAKTFSRSKPKAPASRKKSSATAKRRKASMDSEAGDAEDELPVEPVVDEDNSEEGELPSAARGRQQRRSNAAVEEDEEESDSDEESEDYDDGYGSDLTELPEVERERILLERYQKRQERKEQLELRKRLQINKGAGVESEMASAVAAARKKAAMERAKAAAARAAVLEDVSSGDSDDNEDKEEEEEEEEDGAVERKEDIEKGEEEEEEEEGDDDVADSHEDLENGDEDDFDGSEPGSEAESSRPAATFSAAAKGNSAAVLADEEEKEGEESGAEVVDGDVDEDKDDDDSAPVRGGVSRAQGRGKKSTVAEESEESEASDRDDDDNGRDEDSRREDGGKDDGAAVMMDSDEDYGEDGEYNANPVKAGDNRSSARRNRSRSPSSNSDESLEDSSRYSRGAAASSMPSAGGSSGSGRDRYRRSSRSRSTERRSRSRDRDRRHSRRGASRSWSRSRSRSRSRSVERRYGGEPREPVRPPEPEPSLDDINRCRVPRDYLERWANEPYFEKAVKGCFVRVSRGVDRGGKRVYVMSEIVGIGPYKRRYKMGDSFTSKCLKISSSTAQIRDQCMDIVSNSRITEDELTHWREGRKGVKSPVLTKSQCIERRNRMEKIVQGHKYSVEEVATMVKERRKEGMTFSNVALSRITLSNSLEAAIANRNEEEADFCRVQLAKLDEREAKTKRRIQKGASGMRAINERAKSYNVNTDASIGRQKRLDDVKRREASAAGDNIKFDPFQRRSCRPKILWSVGPSSSVAPPAEDVANANTAGGAADASGVDPSSSNSVSDLHEGGKAEKKAPLPEAQPKPVGIQKMHSFEGVDILEAGRVALEKKLSAVRPKTAPRQGVKLTIGKYLQKARPSVDD